MRSTSASIRVCIIEDHHIVRAGLKAFLQAEPDIDIVGEAQDRKGAFDVVRETHPSLLLVDIRLGKESVLDFIEELLLAASDARALILTGTADEEQIHHAVTAGVTGVVFKDEGADVLVRAIRTVHRGEVWLSRSVMASAISRLRATRTTLKEDPEHDKIASLTAREREVVVHLANGLNRRKIAERLCVSDGTVRNHLTAIFGKLEVFGQFELVFYAQRHGLDKQSEVRRAEPPSLFRARI